MGTLTTRTRGTAARLCMAILVGLAVVLGSLGPARPAHAAAAEPLLGEIRLFPYQAAPNGWMYCAGQELSIAANTALFSLIGNNFGGNGATTFALPDLRTEEPSEGVGYYIATSGIFPSDGSSGGTRMLGEVRLFPYNFTPGNWVRADNRELNIASYTTLFALIGFEYGGDNATKYRVPGIAPLQDGINYYIAFDGGVFPSGSGTGFEYIGELVAVPDKFVAPAIEWPLADGRTLPILMNTPLFSLIGTKFGGDGATTFAVPKLTGGSVKYYIVGNGIFPNINMSPAPAAAPSSFTINQNTTLQRDAASGLLSGASNANPLSALLVDAPDHGALTLQPDGAFQYVPAAGFAGADQFTYRFSSNYRSSENVNVTIAVIDATPPVVTGVEEGRAYKEPVTITFNEGTAKLNGTDLVSGAAVNADSAYTLVVTDTAGNATTVHFSIDKTAPVVTGVTEGTTYNAPVTITFNEGTAKLNDAAFAGGTAVSADGSYTLVVTDTAGNATTVHFSIDKTAPVVTGVTEGTTYNAPVTITFNEGTAKLNDAVFAGGTAVSTDGSYTLVVTDAAGNATTVHFSIDKTAPVVTGVTEGTAYNAPVTVTFNEGTAKLNGAAIASGTAVSADGVYTLVVTDAVGNAATVHFTVTLPVTYTVAFQTNGGSEVGSQSVTSGGKIARPANPTRSGYSFLGWYSDSGRTQAYDFNTAVTGNLTLYAGWMSIPVYVPSPPVKPAATITIDGKPGTAQVTEQKLADGRPETYVVLTESGLSQLLAGNDSAVYTIGVTGESESIRVDLPVKVLQALAKKDADAVVIIQGLGASYRLPVSLFIDAPQDGIVTVIIAKASKSDSEAIANMAEEDGVNVLMERPIEFGLLLSGKTIFDFGGAYVDRTLTLTGTVDADKATAVWVDDNGEQHFVPSEFQAAGGVVTVTIHSPHNSIYTVVQSDQSFNDMGEHPARADVELMANKQIVNGQKEDKFAPDSSITRAEFAAILVRALGLTETLPEKPFTDVPTKAWYAGAVGAAYKAGLITGFTDGSFRPHDSITREQVITMIARALAAGGYEADHKLNTAATSFTDRGHLSAWAADEFLVTLDAGILHSSDGPLLRPKDEATRAECVVLVKRILQVLSFI